MASKAARKIINIPLRHIDLGDRGRQDYGDIEELAENIKVHGLLQPITISPIGEDDVALQDKGFAFRLVTGGRRYRAHEHLELTHIDCIVREVSSDVDLRELELVENVYRKDLTWQERCKMEYDLMNLKGMTIRELAEDIDSTKSAVARHVVMGEALEQIPALGECKSLDDARKSLRKMKESLMAEVLTKRAEAEVVEVAEGDDEHSDIMDAAPEDKPDVLEKALVASKAVTSVDELTTHRLKLAAGCYQIGDCIESMAQFGEPQSFHFAEIDPPYGIDLKNAKKQEGSADGSDLETYTEVDADEYYDFLCRVADEVYVKLTTDAFAIFWFGPTHQHATYKAIQEAGFQVNDVPGIWAKESGQTQQPSLHLANCYEPFYVARKGGPPLKKQGRSNIFRYKAVPPTSKYHPTQRPIELMDEILQTFVYSQKMRILVPFLGSGVTIRAAFNLGMLATGWDLSTAYRDQFLLQIREDAHAEAKSVDEAGSGSEGSAEEGA